MIVSGTLSWRMVIRYTGRPVALHVLLATAIVAAYEALDATWISVPALPLTVLAAALGILLAFRNNNAYDRWWEARTLWGAMVNSSRSFARQILTFLPAQETARISADGITEDGRELVYAQIGFVNALRCHLRGQNSIAQIAPFFRPPVLEALRQQQNVPNAILVWMGTRLRRLYSPNPGPEEVFRLMALDGTLTDLTNILGGCERIKNTPIPRQYDVLPRAMVRAYLAMMPLGVVAELGLLTPLVTAIIAFLFVALDAVGREIETPFEDDVSDTPMTALCRTIEINLLQMLGETAPPSPVKARDGVLY